MTGGKVIGESASHSTIHGTVSDGSVNHSTVAIGQTVNNGETIDGTGQNTLLSGGSSYTYLRNNGHTTVTNDNITSRRSHAAPGQMHETTSIVPQAMAECSRMNGPEGLRGEVALNYFLAI